MFSSLFSHMAAALLCGQCPFYAWFTEPREVNDGSDAKLRLALYLACTQFPKFQDKIDRLLLSHPQAPRRVAALELFRVFIAKDRLNPDGGFIYCGDLMDVLGTFEDFEM